MFSEAMRRVSTDVLEIEFADLGPPDGDPVVLLHGFPYDIHSFREVAPLLVESGRRVIVPYLRGCGGTRSLSSPGRSGQQAAIGADVIALLDAVGLQSAVLAGFDWGARAGCVAAALWPERCSGLVSVSGYLIQDIEAARNPLAPSLEAGLWYFFYFATERGRAGLSANRREIARVIWTRNSPLWSLTEADLDLAAKAFENPDYVEVVIHSYRHRLGLAAGDALYAEIEERLTHAPPIGVPTITLDGAADGNFPATDGTAYGTHLTGPHEHRIVPSAGHNLPQEAPDEFVGAILDLEALERVPGQSR